MLIEILWIYFKSSWHWFHGEGDTMMERVNLKTLFGLLCTYLVSVWHLVIVSFPWWSMFVGELDAIHLQKHYSRVILRIGKPNVWPKLEFFEDFVEVVHGFLNPPAPPRISDTLYVPSTSPLQMPVRIASCDSDVGGGRFGIKSVHPLQDE